MRKLRFAVLLLLALQLALLAAVLPASAPSAVSTTTSLSATRYSFQRACFYANGRFWVFYGDSDGIVYRTSVDGASWSAATAVRSGSAIYFSVWFDGVYLHYAYAGNGPIYYRRGIPNHDGTITWSAGEQTVSTTHNSAVAPFVSVDSDGYVWIGYQDNYYPFVIRSGKNDGTWGTTPSGFPHQLSSSASSSWYVSVVPLTDGKMLVVYTNGPVYLKSWNGSAWRNAVATTSTVSNEMHSVVADGDDADIVFYSPSGGRIIHVRYTYSTNSLSSEHTIVSGAPSDSSPVLCRAGSTLYVFWATKTTGSPSGAIANHIYYQTSTDNGATWSSPVDWVDESAETLTSARAVTCFYQAFGGYVGLLYMTKSSSPYNVKFEKLIQLTLSLAAPPSISSNTPATVQVTASHMLGHSAIVNVTLQFSTVLLRWDSGGFAKALDPYGYCALIPGSCSVQVLNSTAIRVTFAFALSGRMPPGALTMTAQANNVAQASAQVSFTPLKPTPASPANGSGPVAPGEALTFSWTLPQGVAQTAFELQIDDSPLFSSPLLDTGKVPSGAASYSHAVGKAGRWYWRVKVWDGFDVDTGWSSVYVLLVGYSITFYGPFWDNGTRCAEPATVTVYMGGEYEPITFTLSNDTLLLMDARPIFASYSFSGGVNRVLYLASPESVFFVSRPRSEYMAVYTVQLVDYAGVLTGGVFFQVAAYFPEAGGFEPVVSVPASYSVEVILEYGCIYLFRLVKPGWWTIDLQAVTPGVGSEIRVPVRLNIGDEAAAAYKYVTVDVNRTGASVIVAYRDQLEANSTAVIEIVNYYTGVLVWSEERHGAVWQLIYPYADPDAAYRVTVTVNHPRLGQLRFVKAVPGRPLEANPFSVGLDAALGEIPLPGGGRLPLSQAVAAFLILVFAGLFSTRNAYYGAAATVAFAFLLYYLGWFRADLAALTVCLGLAVIFLFTEKYRRELT
ncbi:MAG: sialidase family protein [Thermofilaceae archaeon]